MKEVRSRHGRLVAVATEGDSEITDIADDVFFVPAAPELLLPIIEVIPLQLFAYHVATKKGYDVDRPRNLVKAVVTEKLQLQKKSPSWLYRGSNFPRIMPTHSH